MLSNDQSVDRLAGSPFARERLACLRAQLDAEIPRRTLEETLLLATWNIREFDSPRYGRRTDEAMLYIAEIISRFDIVAIQEVREDLEALDRLVRLLGPWWRYVCTDVTFGRPGNRERMAYLFDKRKVRFSGISGEIVVPPIEIKRGRKTLRYQPARQLVRTPHICGFKSGDYRFMLCQVHIDYGAGVPDDPVREEEVHVLANLLAERARQERAWSNNIILLGDFNIFSPADVAFDALTSAGFRVPEALSVLPSNAAHDKHYDQIAFLNGSDLDQTFASGVFDYYRSVFRDSDEELYAGEMGQRYERGERGRWRGKAGRRRYWRGWRTYQMSDHLVMWVGIDLSRSTQ